MRDLWTDKSWSLFEVTDKWKARELGMLNILADHIRDMSWMSHFHSSIQWHGWCLGCLEAAKSVGFGELGMLKRRDLNIVDIGVQGLDLRCDMTAFGFVSWECA